MMMSNASMIYPDRVASINERAKEANMYFMKSVQAVQKNFQDPKQRLSEVTMSGILGFACQDVS
jgi:hypothetical protein